MYEPQDSSTESSNGGWESSGGGGRTEGVEASKWEQSKQKGSLGYYFAHHITMKELAPEDYQMNGPRLLSKVCTHIHRQAASGTIAE